MLVLFLISCETHLGITGNDLVQPKTGTVFEDLVLRPVDENGWTIISSAEDTITVYVSRSGGNDADDGLTPDTAVQTLGEAYSRMRSGYPDHMKLLRGDVWEEGFPTWRISGRSKWNPLVVSDYGSSSDPRPMLRGNYSIGIDGGENVSHVWFIGLELYCPAGDDTSPDFDLDVSRPSAFHLTGGGSDILIEDCKFSFFRGGMVIQSYGGGRVKNIRIRRNIITDMFNTDSHSQGMYTYEIDGLLIEENVFDHNGWRIPGDGGTQDDGMATMFNHNAYINQTNQIMIRGNLFLRGSSIGVKMCSNDSNESILSVFDDNLFYDGEIGISIGGNGEMEYRFANSDIVNNVFLNIGIGNHTGREFGWALDLKDNCDSRVTGNCFLNQPMYGNSYAVHLGGISNKDISVYDNLAWNIRNYTFIVNEAPHWQNVNIRSNIVDAAGNGFNCVQHNGNFKNVCYYGNRYITDSEEPYRVSLEWTDRVNWKIGSGEKDTSFKPLEYPDNSRTLESYSTLIGADGTAEGFIALARGLSKANWNEAYTAAALNSYLRSGFARKTVVPRYSIDNSTGILF